MKKFLLPFILLACSTTTLLAEQTSQVPPVANEICDQCIWAIRPVARQDVDKAATRGAYVPTYTISEITGEMIIVYVPYEEPQG